MRCFGWFRVSGVVWVGVCCGPLLAAQAANQPAGANANKAEAGVVYQRQPVQGGQKPSAGVSAAKASAATKAGAANVQTQGAKMQVEPASGVKVLPGYVPPGGGAVSKGATGPATLGASTGAQTGAVKAGSTGIYTNTPAGGGQGKSSSGQATGGGEDYGQGATKKPPKWAESSVGSSIGNIVGSGSGSGTSDGPPAGGQRLPGANQPTQPSDGTAPPVRTKGPPAQEPLPPPKAVEVPPPNIKVPPQIFTPPVRKVPTQPPPEKPPVETKPAGLPPAGGPSSQTPAPPVSQTPPTPPTGPTSNVKPTSTQPEGPRPRVGPVPPAVPAVGEVLPVLTLTMVTGRPVAGRDVVVAAALDPERAGMSYRLNWGDGSPVETVSGEGTHRYARAGSYKVSASAVVGRRELHHETPLDVGPVPWPKRKFLAALLAALAGLGMWGMHMYVPKLSASFRWGAPGVPEMRLLSREPYLSLSFEPGLGPAEERISFFRKGRKSGSEKL